MPPDAHSDSDSGDDHHPSKPYSDRGERHARAFAASVLSTSPLARVPREGWRCARYVHDDLIPALDAVDAFAGLFLGRLGAKPFFRAKSDVVALCW